MIMSGDVSISGYMSSSSSKAREKVAEDAGNNLSKAEDALMKSYTLDPESDAAKAFITEQGYDPNTTTLQGLQEALNVKYKRAARVYTMISQLLNNMHQMLMNIIRNMRVS